MKTKIDIIDQILDAPHWRVIIRPTKYKNELLPTLAKCYELIETNKLSLRGWDYPHLSRSDREIEYGSKWLASWSYREYWRLYQSGQFLHLFFLKEAINPEWRKETEIIMRSHLSHIKDIDWQTIPGYISIINFNFQVTEIYEFAARLCAAGLYTEKVEINIELKNVQGFLLAAPWERSWYDYHAASSNTISLSRNYQSEVLIAASHDESLKAIAYLFERFGWLSPPLDVLRHDQGKLLTGRF